MSTGYSLRILDNLQTKWVFTYGTVSNEPGHTMSHGAIISAPPVMTTSLDPHSLDTETSSTTISLALRAPGVVPSFFGTEPDEACIATSDFVDAVTGYGPIINTTVNHTRMRVPFNPGEVLWIGAQLYIVISATNTSVTITQAVGVSQYRLPFFAGAPIYRNRPNVIGRLAEIRREGLVVYRGYVDSITRTDEVVSVTIRDILSSLGAARIGSDFSQLVSPATPTAGHAYSVNMQGGGIVRNAGVLHQPNDFPGALHAREGEVEYCVGVSRVKRQTTVVEFFNMFLNGAATTPSFNLPLFRNWSVGLLFEGDYPGFVDPWSYQRALAYATEQGFFVDYCIVGVDGERPTISELADRFLKPFGFFLYTGADSLICYGHNTWGDSTHTFVSFLPTRITQSPVPPSDRISVQAEYRNFPWAEDVEPITDTTNFIRKAGLINNAQVDIHLDLGVTTNLQLVDALKAAAHGRVTTGTQITVDVPWDKTHPPFLGRTMQIRNNYNSPDTIYGPGLVRAVITSDIRFRVQSVSQDLSRNVITLSGTVIDRTAYSRTLDRNRAPSIILTQNMTGGQYRFEVYGVPTPEFQSLCIDNDYTWLALVPDSDTLYRSLFGLVTSTGADLVTGIITLSSPSVPVNSVLVPPLAHENIYTQYGDLYL